MEADISIIIPFFNEKNSLKELISLLLEQMRSSAKKFEIIFVDDASTDNGAEIIKAYQEKYPMIKLIQFKKRSGQTSCYKEGFLQARGNYFIRMDADLQDNPKDLPEFLEKIDSGSDLVIGVRKHRKHSAILRWASGIFDFTVSKLFNLPFHYHTGSFVAFKADLVKQIPFRKNDHRYLPLIAIMRGAKNVSNVLVEHGVRLAGKSKYHLFPKIIFGIPEVILFLIRCKFGVYGPKFPN